MSVRTGSHNDEARKIADRAKADDRISKLLEDLKELGVQPRGYDLESPHARRRVHSADEDRKSWKPDQRALAS